MSPPARVIWKFILTPGEPTRMPEGARIISVHAQRDDVCLWAEVEPDAAVMRRRFLVVPTGAPVPRGAAAFLGTVLLKEGALVFHIYSDEETDRL